MHSATDHQDPSMEPIQVACEKMIYDLYLQNQSGLVASIDQLIRIGHSPTHIANRVKLIIPVTSQVYNHVFLMAMYLFRRQRSSN